MAGPPRLLRIEDESEARRAAMSVGADADAAASIGARMPAWAIRFNAVSCAQAAMLRHEMRSLGGDAALNEGCQSGSVAATDVILVGSPAAFRQLCTLLRSQAGGLAELAADIHQLLNNLQAQPLQLLGLDCCLDLRRPQIMGVLNVTPDSFSDGGAYQGVERALARALKMAAEGADILDIGGESTRPGAEEVSTEEEINRVVPVIEAIRKESGLPISIDTTKSLVARQALAAGANFINDISGLCFDPAMVEVAAETGAGVFLMHTRGRPGTMQNRTEYHDLIGEILAYLQAGVEKTLSAGIPRERLCIDPGIGFGKTARANLEILRRLDELRCLGLPILLGTSRKSFIGQVLGQPEPAERLHGTMATLALGVERGANILRVHDVRPARETAMMSWALRNQAQSTPT